MENTTQEKIVDANFGIKDYRENVIDLRDEKYLSKPRYFEVKNWRTIEKMINGEPTGEWRADVLKYGDSISLLNIILDSKKKQISEIATSFRLKVNKELAGKNPQQSVMLRIKYSGKKNGKHDFDVELG